MVKRPCIVLFKKDPILVSFLVLTASILHVGCIIQMVIDKVIRKVLGGLHATVLSKLELNYLQKLYEKEE